MKKFLCLALLGLIFFGGCSNTYTKRAFKGYKKTKENKDIVISERKNSTYYKADIDFGMFEPQMFSIIRKDKTIKIEELSEQYLKKKKEDEEAEKKKKEDEQKKILEDKNNTTSGAIDTVEIHQEQDITDNKKDNNDEDTFTKKEKKQVEKEQYLIYLCTKYKGKDWIYLSGVRFIDPKSKYEMEIPFGSAVSKDIIRSDGVTVFGGVYESTCFTVEKKQMEKLYKYLKDRENLEMTFTSNYDIRVYHRRLTEKERKQILEKYEYSLILNNKLKEEIKSKKINIDK